MCHTLAHVPAIFGSMVTYYCISLEEALRRAKAAGKRPGCYYGGITLPSGKPATEDRGSLRLPEAVLPNTDQERKRPLRAENAADATLQSCICRENRPEMPFSLLVRIGMRPVA